MSAEAVLLFTAAPAIAGFGEGEGGAEFSNTALSSSANPSVVGQSVTYTATISADPPVTNAGGSVAFTDGSTTIPGCGAVNVDANNQATCTVTYLHPGQHSITASYGGNAEVGPITVLSPSKATLTQTVNKAPTMLTVAPAKLGLLTATYSAKLTGFGGAPLANQPVVFSEQGQTLCSATTNTQGVATCTVFPSIVIVLGPATYTASYAGNGDYVASTRTGRL